MDGDGLGPTPDTPPAGSADGPPDGSADAPTLRLDDALKLAGLVATGGEAKGLIQSGAVRVNGTVETRRKRRLRQGDVIGLADETFEIDLQD